MPLFKKAPPQPDHCPACDVPAEISHLRRHIFEPEPEVFAFECSCGTSILTWSSSQKAVLNFQIHADMHHATSFLGFDPVSVTHLHRRTFGGDISTTSDDASLTPTNPSAAATAMAAGPTANGSSSADDDHDPVALFDYLVSLGWGENRAGSWDDLRTILVRVNELSGQPLTQAEPRKLTWSIRSGGRSQTVVVTCVDGDQGPDWLSIESPCGEFAPDLAMTVLGKLGTEPSLLGLGAALMPGRDPRPDLLAIRYSTTVTGETIRGILTTIDAVAGTADAIEAEVTGGQDVL